LIRREAPPGTLLGFFSSPPTTFDGRGIHPRSVPWSLTMLDPRALTHSQRAEIVADVQAILWQESQRLPDDPRQYGDYWNPGKEDDGEGLEQIADILSDADLKPPDYMPVAKPVGPAEVAAPRVIDPNELLWAARILSGLVRVHRNVIPLMREKVKVAQDILESYADIPDSDPREQRWTIAPTR
jgi:hypothetical protein